MSVKLEKRKIRSPRWASASYAKGCRGPFTFLSHATSSSGEPVPGCRLRWRGLSQLGFDKPPAAWESARLAPGCQLDPKFAEGYAFLGWTHWLDAVFRWSENTEADLANSFELAQKALILDDFGSNTDAYALLCNIDSDARRFDKAVAEGERAVATNLNDLVGYTACRVERAGRLWKARGRNSSCGKGDTPRSAWARLVRVFCRKSSREPLHRSMCVCN
jgi:hypothetical protein